MTVESMLGESIRGGSRKGEFIRGESPRDELICHGFQRVGFIKDDPTRRVPTRRVFIEDDVERGLPVRGMLMRDVSMRL